MATAAHPLAPPAGAQEGGPQRNQEGGSQRGAAETAAPGLVAAPHAPEMEPAGIALSGAVRRLPVELDVAVPLRGFRVRNLLALEPGNLIESGWGHGEDVPLAAGEVQLAWSEFEVIDTQLAVRVTRLA